MAKDTVHVKIKWNDKKIRDIEQAGINGLFQMAFDIAANARHRAPYLTGALSNSIRVSAPRGNSIEIIAGGTFGNRRVDYALIREKGPNRLASTEHYMENAKNDVMSGDYINKYFGEITK